MGSDIVTCVLCAVRRGGQLLLLRRNAAPYAGLWGLVGGKVEFGEQIGAAAERETGEETGLAARFVRIAGVVNETLTSDGRVTDHFTLYVCELHSAEGDPQESPEGALSWFTEAELLERRPDIIPTDYRMIESLVLADDEAPDVYEASMTEGDGRYYITRFAPVRVMRDTARKA